ncbi:MAG: type I glyceraldehyde-3-phosphate dehydrogenase [Micromonosporaceae bacterium]|nr:type I glyceraldehyde-3-phosphate dehydrogenase [Micromonosporaceae bacterium]
MTVRIGINGVGRIGRNLWRIIQASAPDIEIAVVNDTAELATVAHLLRYDTVRGRFPAPVGQVSRPGGEALTVDGAIVPMRHEPVPDRIPWGRYGVDLVVESTGQFARGQAARGHLSGGAGRVIISTASPDADVSLMMGVNEHDFDPDRHRVVSNSCCTTYCLATMIHALRPRYEVIRGSATIAYSHGSRPGPLLDGVFPNLRMARANATSIVPANVPGVRHALDRVLPDLAGQITATAMRVPVRATSAATLLLRTTHPADPDELNATLEAAAASLLKGYLEVSRDPLVSSDLIGSAASSVVDAGLTTTLDDLVRVVGWYDNEWGYANRLVDLIRFLACPPAAAPCPG